jgi:membrane-associated phospholipid phosphatase
VRLPVIQSTRGHATVALLTIAVCAPMYFIPQRWQFATPVELPLTALDRAIPFWPASGLVYFGAFVFLLATFFALRDRERVTRFLYANVLAQVIAMLVFLFWPTLYPREAFPLPDSASTLGAALVNYVRATDAPVNCLPSLHVSTATLCVLTWRGSRWFGAALVIGPLLALSTLTFKQHYVADVLTGAMLGACAWWCCFRWRGLRLG